MLLAHQRQQTDTRRHRILLNGRLLDVPFKLEVGILLGVGAYSAVGADSVLYGINRKKRRYFMGARNLLPL